MFDMQSIGRTIASARKAHDMTQMELADKLNISFQAISNWERGISMPDISKLPEIAEILGLSIDELLGKSSPVINGLLSDEKEAFLKTAEIEPEEILEAAPILKPSQLEDVIENAENSFDNSDLTSLLPFLDDEFVDELTQNVYEKQGADAIRTFLPFASMKKIDALATQEYQNGQSITGFLPFMRDKKIVELAKTAYEEKGLKAIQTWLPFIEDSFLQEIAKNEFSKHGFKGLSPILPFLDEDWLTDIVKKQMKL